jgi:signal transduction histidine kinase
LADSELVLASGKSNFVAVARLMVELGDQLITDEVAAVSELIKNAYDADALEVQVILRNVSDREKGEVVVIDNGNGMTRQNLLKGWLELGTGLKARKPGGGIRRSEFKKRPYLGEKGLGRLSVHKLGSRTEVITRRVNSETESHLVIDWNTFVNANDHLQDIPVGWEETKPTIFKGDVEPKFKKGTCIKITGLNRTWTRDMMERLVMSVNSLVSPLSGIKDFEPKVLIDDPAAPKVEKVDILDRLKKVTYVFEVEISKNGKAAGTYEFTRRDYPKLNRKIPIETDLKKGEQFAEKREPICGPIGIRFYSWELLRGDKKELFGDSATYEQLIRPNTGVRVFRDGFRVLPYGNENNDWLEMDARRVGQFGERISRNLIIGMIEITSKSNPSLLDKSDREGLIDNDAFQDFKTLILSALAEFEAERLSDRTKLKEEQGRKATVESKFTQTLNRLGRILDDPKRVNLEPEVKHEIRRLVLDSRVAFEDALREREEPLLTAASIGLTYMVPTHEIRRDLQEVNRRLRVMVDAQRDTEIGHNLSELLDLVREAQDLVSGVASIMQQGVKEENLALAKSAKSAMALLSYKMQRNNVKYSLDVQKPVTIRGNDRMLVISLVNMLDNSIYWLGTKKQEEKMVKIVVAEYNGDPTVVVSDNGPGIQDDIELITMPFFTRKPKGMGLGLFICDRMTRMQGGMMKLLRKDALPGLLPGANIAMVFPKKGIG